MCVCVCVYLIMCDREISTMRRPRPNFACCVPEKLNIIYMASMASNSTHIKSRFTLSAVLQSIKGKLGPTRTAGRFPQVGPTKSFAIPEV